MIDRVIRFAVGLAIFSFVATTAADISAAIWTIDSAASSLTLSVPRQVVNVNGLNSNVEVRNPTGTGTAWTTNTTHISGSVNTTYDEAGQTIQFLGGQVNIMAVDSGSFQPNPAVWNAGSGTFADTSSAAADLGGSLTILPPPVGTFKFPFSIYNTMFDLSSGTLPFVLGGTVDLQANGGMTLGTASSMIGFQGGLVGLGASLPSSNGAFSFSGANSALTGTITAVGSDRQLVIPIQQSFNIVIGGVPVHATSSGTLVMNLVPEPSSVILAATGLVSLLVALVRNLRR
jgi:hypothetical protein